MTLFYFCAQEKLFSLKDPTDTQNSLTKKKV